MAKANAIPWVRRLLPARQRAPLPARVQARVRAQETASEILVGWIQLAVVLGFSIVYLLAPKTFSDAAPFRPVPWVLAAYLAFTLLRLALAHRHRLPEWLRYASIAIDMSLLVGMIWSFHLQYQQPPSFYLKAPTLLYVFIFIALRTLNFDARKVVTAGVVAVVGWIVLVVYVITIDPRDRMITRDYVQYMTSNSVLIGAEVDKVIAILVVTAILGFAIMRNRRLLTYAVTESASNQDLARFVPEDVARSDQDVRRRRAGRLRRTARGDGPVSRPRGLHDAVGAPRAGGSGAHAQRVLRSRRRADRESRRRHQPVPGRRGPRDVQCAATQRRRTRRTRSPPRSTSRRC